MLAAPSSSGLGRRAFIPKIAGSIPAGVTFIGRTIDLKTIVLWFTVSFKKQKTKKDRRLLGEQLTKFFASNGWVFDEQSARVWISNKSKGAKESSIGRYIAQIRAFNSYCIERRYLAINFCQWIAKPPENKMLKPHLDLSHKLLLKAIQLGTQVGKGDRSRSIKSKMEGKAALMFMLFTSRRSGEMTKLLGSDININASIALYYAHLKGGNYLSFPIPENLITMMRARQNKDKVFEVTADATIEYLRRGLRKLNISEEILKEVNNHTLRKAFAKERYRNGDDPDKIAEAMADTIDVVRKYYLDRDLEKIKETVNNTREAKQNIPEELIIESIRASIRMYTKDDPRFNPLAAEEALDIKKLLH